MQRLRISKNQINSILKVFMGIVCLFIGMQIKPVAAEEITDIQVEYSFWETSINFDYNDEWFESPASDYSPKLAATSLGLAMSTFCTRSNEGRELSDGVSKMLQDMHFQNMYHNDYYNEPTTANGIAVAFGTKQLDDTTLIAVAVRGGRYGLEWSGNFTTGMSELNHSGFEEARDIVIDELNRYMADYVETSRVKFWITGFSRGAAVANLTAAYINDGLDGYEYTCDDVYSYCFETPANTVNTEPAKGYENIFNIIDPNDLVPKIPPALWGFTRYGRNVYIPERGVNPEYDIYLDRYKKEYELNSGFTYGADMPEDDIQFEVVNRCITVLAGIMKSRANYGLLYQDLITGLMENGTDGINYFKLFIILYQAYDEILLDESGEFSTQNLKNGFTYLGNHALNLGSSLLNHTPIIVLSWLKALNETDVMKNCIEDNSVDNSNSYSVVYLRVYGDISSDLGEPADGYVEYIDEEGAKVYILPWGTEAVLTLKSDKDEDAYLCMSSYALDSAVCNKAVEHNILISKEDNIEYRIASGKKGSDFIIEPIAPAVKYISRELNGSEAKSFLPFDTRADIDWSLIEPETEEETETETEEETETETETENRTYAETVTEAETENEIETEGSIEPETENKTGIIIVIAAVVVICLLIILILTKRKHKNNGA